MSFNPFEQKPCSLESTIMDWSEIRPYSYNKQEVDPYTRTRVILMNGTEFEANWFLHQFQRNCSNNNVRRALAVMRRSEQLQQKLISLIKPANETLLEHTIGYEQLAVDLTAHLAKKEKDPYVKKALDFALLEDFDHLYRYADYLDYTTGTKAEDLVGKYTEIMPGRPTIAHHRHPVDTVRFYTDSKKGALSTNLCVNIITAAEQQTMNFYMNVCGAYPEEKGRELYQEIGMVEEDHVTHYGSLLDVKATWLENLLMHQYTECYLYYSMLKTETVPAIKSIWERLLDQEISHLHAAAQLLCEEEGKHYTQVLGKNVAFPDVLKLESNIDYVRDILCKSVQVTPVKEKYSCVNNLADNADFFRYQNTVNKDFGEIRSHTVIEDYIKKFGQDYRFEVDENPIEPLRKRTSDNTEVGRTPGASTACSL